MVDFKLILIIGLLVLAYYQYQYPAGSHEKLAGTLGKAAEWINGVNPMAQKPTTTVTEESPCPTTDNPVCGNGVTYKNICYAALEDVIQVTPGACQ